MDNFLRKIIKYQSHAEKLKITKHANIKQKKDNNIIYNVYESMNKKLCLTKIELECMVLKWNDFKGASGEMKYLVIFACSRCTSIEKKYISFIFFQLQSKFHPVFLLSFFVSMQLV